VAEPDRGAALLEHAGLARDALVVARAVEVATARVQHREQHTVLALHLGVAPSQRAHHLGATDLEPAQVLAVVGPAHLVGVGVAHAQLEAMHRGPLVHGSVADAAPGRVFHRLWSQNHCAGRSRTAASSSAVCRAVSARTASRPPASPSGTSAGRMRSSRRPSGARAQVQNTIGAPVASENQAGPAGVLAGVPKNGTNTPSRRASWSASMATAPPARRRRITPRTPAPVGSTSRPAARRTSDTQASAPGFESGLATNAS